MCSMFVFKEVLLVGGETHRAGRKSRWLHDIRFVIPEIVMDCLKQTRTRLAHSQRTRRLFVSFQ